MTATTVRRTLPPDDPRHGHLKGASAGCLCPRCADAKLAYNRTRHRKLGYGTWRPFIDAEPVRQHLRSLMKAGIGWQRVAAITGIQHGTLSAIIYGRPGHPPTQRIRPYLAEKILAVKATPDLIADGTPVPAVGTVRRLRALVALGYPVTHLAEDLPIHPESVQRIVARNPCTVTNEVARATVALYDRLWDTAPADTWVHRRARRMAQARGWAPPLAWDDDSLDDPNATPDLGEPDIDTSPEPVDDVDEVLVRRALAGHAPLDALNPAEQDALWRAWEKQRRERFEDLPGLTDFATLHGVTVNVAERIRNHAHGLTAAGKPRKKNTTSSAATGRTSERTAA